MRISTATFIRAGLLGLATGSRSTLGVAALANVDSGSGRGRSGLAKVTALACVGELIGDKLPQTPSRLAPAGLGGRLVLGSASGALVARRRGRRGETAAGAVVGLAGAVAGSWLGASWRRRSTAARGSDLPGALIEDAVALTVAGLAAR